MRSVEPGPSLRGAALLLLALLSFAGLPSAAPKRTAGPKVPAAKPETVYVATPAPREERAPEPARSEPERTEARRAEAAPVSPLRNYAQAFGGYAGFYVADLLGTNPFGAAVWEFYPLGTPFFFQAGCGAGTAQSAFSQDVVGGFLLTNNNVLLSLDALGGYAISGLPSGNGRGGGLFPYFLAGITAFWQGGLPILQKSVPNIGGVIGFGNRMRIPFFGLGRDWAFNYVVRDNVYSPKIGDSRSLTQNFALLVGVQKYW